MMGQWLALICLLNMRSKTGYLCRMLPMCTKVHANARFRLSSSEAWQLIGLQSLDAARTYLAS